MTDKQSFRRDHIAGTEGREPVGCVLSCGVKKPGGGYPIEKDRYHIVVPREDNGRRVHHPAFSGFNSAVPDKRKMIRGNLVHATKADCYEGYLRNQVGPKPPSGPGAHPNRMPFCTGDGVHAVRWLGDEADNFQDIKCPNERCEFRLTAPPTCKPFTRLLFRIRWPDGNPLPSLLCKFTSGGWNTYCNVLGLFDYLEKTAANIGLEHYNLFGFPFTMTLIQQTKPSEKTKFPVTIITPEADPVEFFARQSERIKLAQDSQVVSIEDQRLPEIEAEDVSQLTVPSKRG
jgi:hypothetical protein